MKINVQSGDTLHRLLLERGVPQDRLAEVASQVVKQNNLSSTGEIKAGSTLVFPDEFRIGDAVISLGGPTLAEDFEAKTSGTSAGKPVGVLGKFAHAQKGELRTLTAGIDVLDVLPAQAFPKIAGYQIEKSTDQRTFDSGAKNESGENITLVWNRDRLEINGKQVAGPTEDDYRQVQREFKDEVGAVEQVPWFVGHSYDSSINAYGSAGKMLSLCEFESIYTGGAHGSNNGWLTTIDLAIGKRVPLDALLTTKQMDQVVKKVQRELAKFDFDERCGFPDPGDAAEIRAAINTGFALVTLPDGKTAIDIALQNSVHALGASQFQVRLAAPESADFRARIGTAAGQ